MKAFALTLALLTSTSAFAYNTYVAKEHTCSELKNIIASEGKVYIKTKWFGGRIMYSSRNSCDRFSEKAIKVYWRAQDGGCTLAWACERDNSNDR